jgi:Mlc titration factor MtfA (ptsG expression regulator)
LEKVNFAAETSMGPLFAILFIVFIAAVVIYNNWDAISREWGLKGAYLSAGTKERYRSYLKGFTYYERLSPASQDIFLHRVASFMHNKVFEGRSRLQVTEEMMVCVSASAVQLTFGLKRYKLANINTIILYPETFLDSRKNRYKGLTSVSGQIMLSWKDFKDGYLDPADKYNLGLHEMSHALHLNLYVGRGLDKAFSSYIDTWKSIAFVEFKRMQSHEPSFLRSYGGKNMQEFFAVCIEHFFEVPEAFRKALPDVYHHMVILLNQNPLKPQNDYKVDEWFTHEVNRNFSNIPVPEFIKKNFKYSSWHWSLTVLLSAVLLGPLSLMYLYPVTVLSGYSMLLLFAVFAVCGILQWPYFRRLQILSGSLFYLYAILGFGTFALIVMLWLNALIPITSEYKEEYNIVKAIPDRSTRNAVSVPGYTLVLEGEAYDDVPAVRFVDEYHGEKKVGLKFRRGLFGIKVLRGYYFLKNK